MARNYPLKKQVCWSSIPDSCRYIITKVIVFSIEELSHLPSLVTHITFTRDFDNPD